MIKSLVYTLAALGSHDGSANQSLRRAPFRSDIADSPDALARALLPCSNRSESRPITLQDIAAFDDINKKRQWPATWKSPYQISGDPFTVDDLRKTYVGEKLTPELQDKLTSDFLGLFGEYLEGITLSYERSSRDPSLKDNEVRLIFNWREPELPPVRGLRVVGTSLITEEMKREMLKDLQVRIVRFSFYWVSIFEKGRMITSSGDGFFSLLFCRLSGCLRSGKCPLFTAGTS